MIGDAVRAVGGSAPRPTVGNFLSNVPINRIADVTAPVVPGAARAARQAANLPAAESEEQDVLKAEATAVQRLGGA